MLKKTLISSVAVLGSLILFLAWVFQQTLLEEANSTLQSIHTAQTVYQTYQSTNAMFNAIIATTNDEEAIEQIRRYQIYNYELGLHDMEMLLDNEAKRDIPKGSPSQAYDSSQSVDALIAVTQERLTKIQDGLAAKENEIDQRKSTFNRIFLGIYAVGTVAVLVGSALSVRASSESS